MQLKGKYWSRAVRPISMIPSEHHSGACKVLEEYVETIVVLSRNTGRRKIGKYRLFGGVRSYDTHPFLP